MLQYLIILLDDTSVAYCHAENPTNVRRLIPLETLQKAIHYAMRENLAVQFVLPEYELPAMYYELMNTIDHVIIRSANGASVTTKYPTREITVANSINQLYMDGDASYVLRMSIREVIKYRQEIASMLGHVHRLNLCYTDIDTFTDADTNDYQATLSLWKKQLISYYNQGVNAQLNVLTDRLYYSEMNNCEAGVKNITIAPNGSFYICPAFYYEEIKGSDNKMSHSNPQHDFSVGGLNQGLQIQNNQLLQLDHAPICRICDAFHCHRCVWLNQKQTLEANTPGHEQCLVAHIERNTTRDLSLELQRMGINSIVDIPEIKYLDPFEEANNWK